MIFDIVEFRGENLNPAQAKAKAHYESRTNWLIRLKRGLYTDDPNENVLLIANCLCLPSYVSFEYALSYHGLIPEGVFEITSASLYSRGASAFHNDFGRFSYRNVPLDVFPLELERVDGALIASKEKAVCDILHILPSVRSKDDLRALLFEDMRIEKDSFASLDLNALDSLSYRYPGNTFSVLRSFLKEIL